MDQKENSDENFESDNIHQEDKVSQKNDTIDMCPNELFDDIFKFLSPNDLAAMS